MRRLPALLAFAICAVSVLGCGPVSSQPTGGAGMRSEKIRVPGEYLITASAGTTAEVISGIYGQFGIKSIKNLGQNVYLLALMQDPGLEAMEKLRAQTSHIEAIQPNFTYRVQKQ